MQKIIIFILLVFFIPACREQPRVSNQPVTRALLNKTVQRAIDGITPAADSLSGLIDSSLIFNRGYSNLEIDSIILPSGKYFSILLQYPDPVKNRFGIYNDSLKCLLIDRSLNGELSEKIITIIGSKYINVNEGFPVKNVLEVSRLSLYQIKNDQAHLIFRIFTRLKQPNSESTQILDQFSNEKIITKISSTDQELNAEADVFQYDSTSNSYTSKENYFNNFVISQINSLPND
jgi:hypothetical protein